MIYGSLELIFPCFCAGLVSFDERNLCALQYCHVLVFCPKFFCGEAAGYAHSMVLDTVRKGSVEVPTAIIVILFKHMQHNYIVKSNFREFIWCLQITDRLFGTRLSPADMAPAREDVT